MRRGGGKQKGWKARVRRKQIVEEVMTQDKKKNQAGAEIKVINKKLYERRRPPSPYRLPKVDLKRETSCCLDKDRPLPEHFRPCPNCPGSQKLTEAGSTEAGVTN